MIVRSAVLEGTVAEADRARFEAQIHATVMPAIASYPGIRDLRLRRSVEHEAGAPEIYAVFDLYFDNVEAMHAALASPVRARVREQLVAVMAMFRGRVYHLVQEEWPEGGENGG